MVFNKKFIGFNILSISAPFINEWFLRLDEDIRLCWVEAEFFNLWVFVEVVWGQKTEYYDKKNHIKNVFVMGRQIFLDTMSVCLNNYFKWKTFRTFVVYFSTNKYSNGYHWNLFSISYKYNQEIRYSGSHSS